jgi:hypothetical protein
MDVAMVDSSGTVPDKATIALKAALRTSLADENTENLQKVAIAINAAVKKKCIGGEYLVTIQPKGLVDVGAKATQSTVNKQYHWESVYTF